MSGEILPNVQAACDLLIEEGFQQRVAMVINIDGSVTLFDYDTYVAAYVATMPGGDLT